MGAGLEVCACVGMWDRQKQERKEGILIEAESFDDLGGFRTLSQGTPGPASGFAQRP